MYRPQSLEISHRGSGRYVHIVPPPINKDRTDVGVQFQNIQKINTKKNWLSSGPHLQQASYHSINQANYKLLTRRIDNLDYQISHLIQENDNNLVSGLCQSQSFCEGPIAATHGLFYPDNFSYIPLAHTSRLTACMYMSPPPPQWTTVGNIMSVKRSTSMPGSRPNSVSIPCQTTQRNDISHSSFKKKCGPFQCLKHQFRKSGHKEAQTLRNDANTTQNTANMSMQSMKSSKPRFKKRSTTTTANIADNNWSTKSRGIRKSISLLFSKSNRSSKSDPNMMNNKSSTENQQHINKDNNNNSNIKSYQHASRRNRSYESMLESGEIKLSNETNKSCSYSDVQDSSSSLSSSALCAMKTKAAVSVDVILCRNSSQSSLTDTVSVSSSEQQLIGSQFRGYQGNVICRPEDNGWKTVVGNVCRSNSKDSAIANSTLSGDVVISQSKRVSLTSTMSRTSDITTTSEEFNDSSYSSFNDLQTNFSQYSYSKPRLIASGTLSSNLQPIKVNCDTAESDIRPSSDSSTETLRPLSTMYRQRFRSSHSNVFIDDNHMPPIINNLKQKCLKRSHSWPGCRFHLPSSDKKIDLNPLTKPPLILQTNKSQNFPKLKLSYIKQSNLNSSPLLSQYSRLYSLRASTTNNQRSLYCQLSSSTTQAPVSPGNCSDSVFLRPHPVRQFKNW